MNSLQSITDAWGKWIAKKKGTSCDFTASTNYSSEAELDDYHKYQCTVTTQAIVYDGDAPPTRKADVAYELWYDNASDVRQSEMFTYTATTSQSFTWSVTEALSVGVKVSATEGLPEEASLSEEVSAQVEFSSTQGGSYDDEQSWSVNTPIQVPAQATLKCDMVIDSETYDVDFTQSVIIAGDVAIWFKDKVAWNGNDDDKHYLWFISIGQVFNDVISNKLADTSGYAVVPGGVKATSTGVLRGGQGVSVGVTTTQYPLRSTVSAAEFQPVSSDKIYSVTMAEESAEPTTLVATPMPGGACV